MLFQTLHCNECNQTTGHYNVKCGDCTAKAADLAKRTHFASLQGMTIEERLNRLERNEYEMSIDPPWIEPRY